LNFYPSSPRFISDAVAEQLIRAIDHRALIVGVYVNESWDVIEAHQVRFELDAIQLHGNELPIDVPGFLRNVSIIKATTWGTETPADHLTAKDWIECRDKLLLKGLLVDAYDPIQHGGTGRIVRWDLLNPRPIPLVKTRLILAGGITPENIAEAVGIARPDAVDTASGIEVTPGIKSAERMQKFVEEARKVFIDGRQWLADTV